MRRILLYSGLLLAGMAAAQTPAIASWRSPIHILTQVCLGYIMLQVGLEFSAEAGHLLQYVRDFGVAMSAAVLPWLLCVLYFIWGVGVPVKSACLVGLFAAATSAGILFTMLAAAGVGTTWVFKKSRVLAVCDDLVTILLIIPIQMLFIGFHWRFALILVSTLGLIAAAVRWLNKLFWPVRKPWLLLYGTVLTVLASIANHWELPIGVLLPAFVAGCILHHQGTLKEVDDPHSLLDQGIKALFLFLVGCSLPLVRMGGMPPGILLTHVAALTLLSNLGKCVPAMFYAKEVPLRERLALSVAMFPRGEVGAGVLLVAMDYGITGAPVMLSSLSLAINLLLTGVFVRTVSTMARVKAV
jgi:Kef-type K+ transport system membrane component KefB